MIKLNRGNSLVLGSLLGGGGGGGHPLGTWNADLNVPALVSSIGDQGQWYVVSVAGETDLDGNTGWGVGDFVVFSDGVWNKIENSHTEFSGFAVKEITTDRFYEQSDAGKLIVNTTNLDVKISMENGGPVAGEGFFFAGAGNDPVNNFLSRIHISGSGSIAQTIITDRGVRSFGAIDREYSGAIGQMSYFCAISENNYAKYTIHEEFHRNVNLTASGIVERTDIGKIIDNGSGGFLSLTLPNPSVSGQSRMNVGEAITVTNSKEGSYTNLVFPTGVGFNGGSDIGVSYYEIRGTGSSATVVRTSVTNYAVSSPTLTNTYLSSNGNMQLFYDKFFTVNGVKLNAAGAVTIITPGSGFQDGVLILEIQGGSYNERATIYATVVAGAVVSAVLGDPGLYYVAPTVPATALPSGSGSGCTISVQFEVAGRFRFGDGYFQSRGATILGGTSDAILPQDGTVVDIRRGHGDRFFVSVPSATQSEIDTSLVFSGVGGTAFTWNSTIERFSSSSGLNKNLAFIDDIPAPRQNFVQTSAITVSNTPFATSIVGSGVGDLTIPSDALAPGTWYQVECSGVLESKEGKMAEQISFSVQSGNLLSPTNFHNTGFIDLDVAGAGCTFNLTVRFSTLPHANPLYSIVVSTSSFSYTKAGGATFYVNPPIFYNYDLLRGDSYPMDLVVQWGIAEPENVITSDMMTFLKIA